MKNLKIVFCILFALALFLPAINTQAATQDFDYQYIDKSPSPTLDPGQSTILWVKIKNTGNTAWSSEVVRLGTSNPKDRDSAFMPNTTNAPELNNKRTNWVSTNRILMEKPTAEVGETVGFGFYIKVPANKSAGVYRENFQPVVDGADWMKDTGIYWDITVTNNSAQQPTVVPITPQAPAQQPVTQQPTSQPATQQPVVQQPIVTGTYDYDLLGQSEYPGSMAPGATFGVWIDVKNTGTAIWYKDLQYGGYPVRLGTGSKYGSANQQRDYTSEFANSDWLSSNRATSLDDNIVNPGQTTKLHFNIKAPATPGIYKAYFTPVVDGYQWMKDVGLYWQITVTGESSQSNQPAQCIGEYQGLGAVVPDNNNQCCAGLVPYIPTGVVGSRGTCQVPGYNPNQTNIYTVTKDISIKQGEKQTISLTLKNTTSKQWDYEPNYTTGTQNEFRLGTIEPQDRNSDFYDSETWPSQNRAGNTRGGPVFYKVDPGMTTTMDMVVKVPTNKAPGTYTEKFALVKEGVEWINQMQVILNITVVNNPTSPVATTPLNLKVEQCLTQMFCMSWGSAVRDGVPSTDELYRSTNPNSGFVLVYSGKEGGYKDSNIVMGTTYYYKVRSTFDGSRFSEYTPIVSGHILSESEQPLPNPPVLSVTEKTTNTISLSWTVPTTVYSYMELYYSNDSNGSFTKLWNGLGTSTVHMSLTPNTTYYYKIRAISGGGAGAFSPVLSVTTLIPVVPNTPTNLRIITTTNNSIAIAWDPSANATIYELHRILANQDIVVYSGSNTSYLDNSGLVTGTTYTYIVRAKNSFEYSSYTPTVYAIATDNKLATPVLRVTNVTDSVGLAWDPPVQYGNAYVIEFRDSVNANYTVLANSYNTSTSYTVGGSGTLQLGHTYYFRIRAIDTTGNYLQSDYSTPVSATITIPAIPTGLRVTGVVGRAISLSWNSSSGATDYQLFRAEGIINGTYIPVFAGSATSYTDNPVPYSNNTYYYKVRSMHSAGMSDFSPIVSGTSQ